MKRSQEGEIKGDYKSMTTTMAKCFMFLSQGKNQIVSSPNRVYKCKSCNRQFSSFQALGGHRASHRKTTMIAEDHDEEGASTAQIYKSKLRTKRHECPICGVEFAIGQALGGHMRRHRSIIHSLPHDDSVETSTMTKKSNSIGTTGGFLCLDLNLTPLENDLKFDIGSERSERISTPMLNFFI